LRVESPTFLHVSSTCPQQVPVPGEPCQSLPVGAPLRLRKQVAPAGVKFEAEPRHGLGHPDQDPEVKPRLPLSVVLKRERYEDPGSLDGIKQYDRELRAYYQTRSGGRKDSSWTEEIRAWAARPRPHMREFLAGRGFTLK